MILIKKKKERTHSLHDGINLSGLFFSFFLNTAGIDDVRLEMKHVLADIYTQLFFHSVLSIAEYIGM